jgi:hypothetical protein
MEGNGFGAESGAGGGVLSGFAEERDSTAPKTSDEAGPEVTSLWVLSGAGGGAWSWFDCGVGVVSAALWSGAAVVAEELSAAGC